jgi:hypothetical protein
MQGRVLSIQVGRPAGLLRLVAGSGIKMALSVQWPVL